MVTALALVHSPPAASQEAAARLPIAVQNCGVSFEEFAALVREELAAGGVFQVLDPRSFLVACDAEQLSIQPQPWEDVGARFVVGYTVQGQQISAYLYDVVHPGAPVLTRRYSITAETLRQRAQSFSLDLTTHLRGATARSDTDRGPLAGDCAARVDGQHLVLQTPPLSFASGKAILGAVNAPAVEALACALLRDTGLSLSVEVHTDNIESDAVGLTQTRAEAVRSALVAAGVPANRVQAIGKGADQPVQSNNTAAGRAANRRVELKVQRGARPVASQPAPLPSIDAPLCTGRRAEGEAAVVIGLESYAFIQDVPHAARDAAAFYDFLVYTRGLPGAKAQLLTRGGREHIEAAVTRAASEAGPGGRVWVYFAGHGAADPSTLKRMILGDDVRSDAIAFASRGVTLDALEAVIRQAGATPLLVLDTCYAGVRRGGDTLLAGSRFAVPSYASSAGPGGAQWTAAGPDQLSGPLPGQDHGAFTYFAIGAMRGWADGELDGVRDSRVTAAEAQAFVARALRRSQIAEQQPAWLGPDDLVLSEGGTEVAPL